MTTDTLAKLAAIKRYDVETNDLYDMEENETGMWVLYGDHIAALTAQAPAAAEPVACTYPSCKCPFDAPSDPNWCARGLPKPRPFSFGNDERAMLWRAFDDSPKHALDLSIRAIERLAAQQAAQAPEGWVSVEDRMPEVGQKVIVYRPLAHMTNDPAIIVSRFCSESHLSPQQVEHQFVCWCHPTHWQPLPAPPAARPQAEGA